MARHLLQNYSLQCAIAILKPTRFFTELTRFFCTTKLVFSLSLKPTQLAYRIDSIAWTEPTWFFYRTDSIILQNWLDFFTEPTWFFFYRTDLIILQNWLGDFFTEPTWYFHWTDSVFLLNQLGFFTEPTRFFWVNFFIINKVRTHSRL